MTDENKKNSSDPDSVTGKLNRRQFIRLSTLLGGGIVASGILPGCMGLMDDDTVELLEKKGDVYIVRAACPGHNCGGRCLLKMHIRDGRIIRIETDDRPNDTLEDPQLRACIRGRAYRRRQYHPDRLKYPMKRTGERGEGKFERISWNEALDLLASEIKRVRINMETLPCWYPTEQEATTRSTAVRPLPG
jgi:anaerobic dimethyl sulfoxide reductase subunit A